MPKPLIAHVRQQGLFSRLIGAAYDRFADGPPTLLTARAGERSPSMLAADWQVVDVNDPEDLPILVSHHLQQGATVLAIPAWGYRREASTSSRSPANLRFEEEAVEIPIRGTERPVGLVLPGSSVTGWRSAYFRKRMFECWTPLLVLTAQGVLTGIHPSVEVAFVLLGQPVGSNEPLRIFRMPRDAAEEEVIEDFLRLLKRLGGRSRYGFVLREAPRPGESLAFERHDPRVLARTADLEAFGSTRKLGELFKVMRPWRPRVETINTPGGPDSMRALEGRDILRDGTIAPLDDDAKWVQAGILEPLRVGDYVVRVFQTPTDPGGLVFAELREADLPAVAGRSVVVLRPLAELSLGQRQLLGLFMRSRLCRTLLAASGAAGLGPTRSALRQLPVPQPDEALADALAELTDAASHMESWHEEAQGLLLSVFESQSAAEARAMIIQNGRRLRLRADAAALLDDFNYVIRTRYPYPIAYRWRSLEAHRSGSDLERTYQATLDCFEILLCYAAQLALVMAREADVTVRAQDSIRTKLREGRGGTTLGDWVAVLEEVAAAEAFRSIGPDQPLAEVRHLLAPTAEVKAARQRLSTKRNNLAHQRRFTGTQLSDAADEAYEDLTMLMDRAIFLTDFSLIHMTASRWDTFTQTAKVEFRSLMGDHPVVPFRHAEYARNDLEVDSLYVSDARGDLHLLRPFLLGRECPDCRNWSTFHVDHAGRGSVTIKSLERGHFTEDNSQIDVLERVGIL